MAEDDDINFIVRGPMGTLREAAKVTEPTSGRVMEVWTTQPGVQLYLPNNKTPIIGKGTLERVVRQRRHAPVLIVDLGVPRDVEPEAAKLDDVFLYSVDDLAVLVKDNLQIRRDAVVHSAGIDARRPATGDA